jgi:ribosomal protein S18 acetylase RimI-like enzyme
VGWEPSGVIEIRLASPADEAALRRVDRATWTTLSSPAPAPAADAPFFDDRKRPHDVLVAEVDGVVAGYLMLHQAIPLPSHEHVLEINGLAVDPVRQGLGIGRRLVDEAVQEARRRGAVKLSLRVLAPNAGARRVYESCGFTVEGVLRGEFLLDGRLVDDVLMARQLT